MLQKESLPCWASQMVSFDKADNVSCFRKEIVVEDQRSILHEAERIGRFLFPFLFGQENNISTHLHHNLKQQRPKGVGCI
jgi:hypothetical protein